MHRNIGRPKIALLNRSSARAASVASQGRYQVSNTVRLPKIKLDRSARLPSILQAPASPIPRKNNRRADGEIVGEPLDS
jgi:hypothetical protein